MDNTEFPPEETKNKQSNIKKLFLLTGKFKSNRVARNSTISAIGFVASLFTLLLFTPILVHRMGTDGYGLWSISVSALGMMSMLELGLGLAISKYLAEYHSNNNKEGISAVVTIGLAANLLMGFFITVPLYFFAGQIAKLFTSATISNEDITTAIQISSFGFLPLLIRNTALAIPDGLQRFEFSTVIKVSQNVLVIAVALGVVMLEGTTSQVVFSTVLVMGVASLVSIIIAVKLLKPLIVVFPVIRYTYTKQMFSFMTFAGLRGIGAQLFSSVDRVAVGAVLGLSAVTYYTVCVGVANKFLVLSTQLTQALMPAVSVWYAKDDRDRLKRYFMYTSGLLAVFNLTGASILIVFASKLLTIWMGADFVTQALVPFQILVLIYAIMTVASPAAQFANGMGYPWINAFVAIIGGIGTISLIILWGKHFGLVGAASANVASWIKFLTPIMIIQLLRHTKSQSIEMKYV